MCRQAAGVCAAHWEAVQVLAAQGAGGFLTWQPPRQHVLYELCVIGARGPAACLGKSLFDLMRQALAQVRLPGRLVACMAGRLTAWLAGRQGLDGLQCRAAICASWHGAQLASAPAGQLHHLETAPAGMCASWRLRKAAPLPL